LGSQTGSVGSVRLYPTGDSRYVHEAPQLPKRACETPNFVCNQPRKHRRRSNPTVRLITPQQLGVPVAVSVINLSPHVVVEGIIDLTASVSNGPITDTVGSDSGYQYELLPNQDEEVDPDLL
jgi:hypothetical protein